MEYELSHFMVSQSNSASHLCSRSLHLSQSEWSTPGPCHISHIGSTSCATAGGGERCFKFNNDTRDFQLQCDELHLLSSQDYIKLSSKQRTNQWVINNNNTTLPIGWLAGCSSSKPDAVVTSSTATVSRQANVRPCGINPSCWGERPPST